MSGNLARGRRDGGEQSLCEEMGGVDSRMPFFHFFHERISYGEERDEFRQGLFVRNPVHPPHPPGAPLKILAGMDTRDLETPHV